MPCTSHPCRAVQNTSLQQLTTCLPAGNRGLGLVVCRILLSKGHQVLLGSRSAEAGALSPAWKPITRRRGCLLTLRATGRAAAEQLSREPKARGVCRSLVVDTASSKSIAALADTVAQQQLTLAAVVNNAAVATHEWSQETFDLGMATNFEGPLLVGKLLLPCIQDAGTIVNVSSGLGALSGQSKSYRQQVRLVSVLIEPAICCCDKLTAVGVCQVEDARDLEDLRAIQFDASDTRQAAMWGPVRPGCSSAVPAAAGEGWPDWGPVQTYGLSKAMLNKATRWLAASPELQRRRITANVVCPGWCRWAALLRLCCPAHMNLCCACIRQSAACSPARAEAGVLLLQDGHGGLRRSQVRRAGRAEHCDHLAALSGGAPPSQRPVLQGWQACAVVMRSLLCPGSLSAANIWLHSSASHPAAAKCTFDQQAAAVLSDSVTTQLKSAELFRALQQLSTCGALPA